MGGLNTVSNVVVHCRSHNGREAEVYFGAAYVNARRSSTARGGDHVTRAGEVRSPSPATVDTCRDSANQTGTEGSAGRQERKGR